MNQTSFIDSSNFDSYSDDLHQGQVSFNQVEKIPCAGFNQIFLAEKYGKKWFLKGLKKEYYEQPFYCDLLKKELDISLSLDHPNIVKTFGWEIVPHVGPCIVMEYVDGETLEQAIEKGITPANKVRIVHQLLEAVSYFHSKQIVHRDLKPSNILITHNGKNVKVIDFGLADSDAYAILKQPAGTTRYISPEQQAGRWPDVKNDIYSIGRILQDLQIGRRYDRVIQHCLQPAAQRYENTNQLSQALIHAQKRAIRVVSVALIVAMTLLLIYLTWQVSHIQRSIMLPENWKYLTEQSVVLPQSQEDTTAMPQLENERMEIAVQKGIEQLEQYIRSTKIEEQMDTLTHVEHVKDFHMSHTIIQVNNRINKFCDSIKDDFDSDQNAIICYRICQYVTDTYFNKWTKRLLSLSKYSTPSSLDHP